MFWQFVYTRSQEYKNLPSGQNWNKQEIEVNSFVKVREIYEELIILTTNCNNHVKSVLPFRVSSTMSSNAASSVYIVIDLR